MYAPRSRCWWEMAWLPVVCLHPLAFVSFDTSVVRVYILGAMHTFRVSLSPDVHISVILALSRLESDPPGCV